MYRTRTVPGEKEEFDQDKKDYAAFFPLLLGSIWGPGARGAVRGEDKEGQEQEQEQEQEQVYKDAATIHEAYSLLQRAAPPPACCPLLPECSAGRCRRSGGKILTCYRPTSGLPEASQPGPGLIPAPAVHPKLQSPSVILDGPKLRSTTIILDGPKLRFTTVLLDGLKLQPTTVILDS